MLDDSRTWELRCYQCGQETTIYAGFSPHLWARLHGHSPVLGRTRTGRQVLIVDNELHRSVQYYV